MLKILNNNIVNWLNLLHYYNFIVLKIIITIELYYYLIYKDFELNKIIYL